jgi:hypothetical protein
MRMASSLPDPGLKRDVANKKNSRGVHSALFAFIGAIGFIVSAVLPPDAYSVKHNYRC